MKLKFLFLTLLSIILFLRSDFSYGNQVPLMINNQVVRNEEIVLVIDGVSYGQLTDFTERFDGALEWDSAERMAKIIIDDSVYGFSLESEWVLVDDELKELTSSTYTINGKLYVPLYFLAEMFPFTFYWDTTFSLLSIETDYDIINESEKIVINIDYTEEEVLWLARIIDAEAGGGSLTHQTAVGNVVINRVKSNNFASTIYDVIFQPGQFTPARRSSFSNRVPRETSLIAAERALMGILVAEHCLYFNNRPFTWKDPKDLYMVMEGQYFYR